MERLVHQLTQELGAPYTAETAGHEFYHWRANFGKIELMLYLTVLAEGGRRIAFAAILCEVLAGGMVSVEVRGPDDHDKVFQAIRQCTGTMRGD